MLRKWDSADQQTQKKCIDEIVTRINDIGESGAGVITAQDIIDIVTENLAPEIYNRGISDAKKVIDTKLVDLDAELSSLEVHSS